MQTFPVNLFLNLQFWMSHMTSQIILTLKERLAARLFVFSLNVLVGYAIKWTCGDRALKWQMIFHHSGQKYAALHLLFLSAICASLFVKPNYFWVTVMWHSTHSFCNCFCSVIYASNFESINDFNDFASQTADNEVSRSLKNSKTYFLFSCKIGAVRVHGQSCKLWKEKNMTSHILYTYCSKLNCIDCFSE